MPFDLEAIRKRNEERRKDFPDGKIITGANEEWFDEIHSTCEADIAALLDEVERLRECLSLAEDAYQNLGHGEMCGRKCRCKVAIEDLRENYPPK